MLRALALAFGLMLGGASASPLSFADLDGWAADDHGAALAAFRETCDRISAPDWAPICAFATTPQSDADPRAFFEMFFRPVVIGDPPALFTGYYEPELRGSLQRTAQFAHPLYAKPPEFDGKGQWHSRSVIEERGLLRGRGLELAWLEDPVEAFFLQVQGSGRIKLPDGGVIRLGFAAKNNHPYRSIGAELVRRGAMDLHRVSAQGIKSWVKRNPSQGADLLRHNPSFVFFRRLPDLPAHRGPIGAMSRSVTTMRTLAVDPAFVPLGAPVWVEKDGRGPLRQLMVAQDTGTAIKGAQRADIFYGTGLAAGEAAGRVRDSGRMVTLLPIPMAQRLAEGRP